MVYTLIVTLLAAIGFSAASLLALRGSVITAPVRAYAIAVAAGILLALAFGGLFPESIELGGRRAIVGFMLGFALLYLVEMFTHAHTHHSPVEPTAERHQHPAVPFIIGLAIHNTADGFAVGISGQASEQTALIAGLGVLVHQVPVGLSVAAVLLAAATSQRAVVSTSIGLGLLIPFAAVMTRAVPPVGDATIGMLTGIAAGVLTYVGAAHLLPEARVEHPSRTTGLVFTGVLLLTTLGIFAVLGE